MKYLKKFEAIIIPSKSLGSGKSNLTFNELVEYGRENGFDVVKWDEFYNSIPKEDRENVPPRHAPFFALFHPVNNRPMFVCNIPMIDRSMVDDIIQHEKIHSEQSKKRSGLSYQLPNPNKAKEYFSNKDEIMAFSWTIANGIMKYRKRSKKDLKMEDLIKILDSGVFPEYQIWSTIKSIRDTRIINRYRKYIYLYLEEMLGDASTPHTTL